MVVMYLLLLVGLLKSNGFDIVEEGVNNKIVSQHNDQHILHQHILHQSEWLDSSTNPTPPARFLNLLSAPTWKPLSILSPIELYGRHNPSHP